ncbi:YtxH domain-containing protein [Luteipulveratus mongoliensis]|uniref:Protoporphyrinogen oxidase n=1 Tax=Luteipulveratus mongoliensis TaxID=571913 RepID=A0A0K1JP05_9MICO|nr:YtxH domain-containing protein [Luteipulveratus mongoliensis]AKU18300.1 hypothetical protein VV02_24745 [Luteipulveratus mongoliensis]
MGKLSFLIGLGAGYVLGARAGKQRYEQLKSQANKVWENPSVQSKVGDVAEQVKAKAPAVTSAATSAAQSATSAAQKAAHKVTSKDDPQSDPAVGAHRRTDTTGEGPESDPLP